MVELESIPGSGAIWYYVPSSDMVKLAREERKASAEIGGALLQVFVFRAEVPGTYILNFELKRAWEHVVRRRTSVTVSVS